jgi:hypothetical protein
MKAPARAAGPVLFFFALFLIVLVLRLCHVDILWAEENLPLAAASEMLRGKALYRDIWFDKPPLVPAFYLLWGARDGVPRSRSRSICIRA